jgi:hypothetical protein
MACLLFSAFAGNQLQAQQVTTSPDFTRGATVAFAGGSAVAGETASIKERGICWNTEHNPTTGDSKAVAGNTSPFLCRMNNLEPATVYYVRAYAVSTENETSYGDEIRIITIPKGVITYTKNWNEETDPDNRQHYDRITAAVESAIEYWTNFTSIQTHLTLNYGSETPTAEASYGGWMRFGPNASYQRTGTALHEMAHTIGVGTHAMWSNTALHANGLWLGERANKVLQIMSKDPAAVLKGDTQHFWPYGINGAHEDNGTDMTYLINAMIVQAFGEDGLPPTNEFATPACTFDVKPGEKYYIKTEEAIRGRDTTYLVENEAGNIAAKRMTPEEVLANDSAAWRFDFDPASRYYTIQNAATGKYFVYKSTGTNGIGLTAPEATAGNTSRFQLMASRTATWLGDPNTSIRLKGYWIIYPQATTTPPCLVAALKNATTVSNFNIGATNAAQRWLIFTAEEVNRFAQAIEVNGNRQWEEGAEYSIHPAGLMHGLRSQTSADGLDIVNRSYTQSEPNYSSIRWKMTSTETDGEKRYVFTNARTQKVLTIETWNPVAGEDAEVTACAHTKNIAYDPENDSQHLSVAFVENIVSGDTITQVFTIGNSDKHRLDHFGKTTHGSKIGNTYSTATTIPATQKWTLTLEKGAETAIRNTPLPKPAIYGEHEMLYMKNLPNQALVRVYDISGRPVKTQKANSKEIRIPIAAGLYIVKVSGQPANKVIVH